MSTEKLNREGITERLKGETPHFWKQVRKVMMACGAVGTALAAVPSQYTTWLPSHTIAVLITVGAVGTALASLTVTSK